MLAGLVLGVAGSAHCALMCGPLVAAVGLGGRRALPYHAGRAAVYVLLGIAAGAAGAGMSAAGVGRWWAFSLAAVLLLQASSRVSGVNPVRVPTAIVRLTGSCSHVVREWAARHPHSGAVGMGAMNGLLPCGLVYAATTAAAGLGTVGASVALMAGFALGTTPALTVSVLSFSWTQRRAPALARLTPVLLVLMAALLIVRGLEMSGPSAHLH